MTRRDTRHVKVGGISLGNGAPIAVQTMANTDTSDREATLRQVLAMQEAGADFGQNEYKNRIFGGFRKIFFKNF